MSRYALSQGVLLFFFGLMLFGVQERTLVLFGHKIFTFPIWVYTAYGILAILLSLLFVIVAFRKQLATKLEKFLEGMPTFSYFKWILTVFIWTAFWIVYVLGWLKGMTSISNEGWTFVVLFLLGFAWLIIITILWFKIIIQFKKYFQSQ